MELTKETKLVDFLSHLQANARTLAKLDFEKSHHPDGPGEEGGSDARTRICAAWEDLRRDLYKVCGVDLKPFCEIAGSGVAVRDYHPVIDAPSLRGMTLGWVKKMADKYRRRDPDLKLLKSWVPKPKEEKPSPW